jgi:hypothetical protein
LKFIPAMLYRASMFAAILAAGARAGAAEVCMDADTSGIEDTQAESSALQVKLEVKDDASDNFWKQNLVDESKIDASGDPMVTLTFDQVEILKWAIKDFNSYVPVDEFPPDIKEACKPPLQQIENKQVVPEQWLQNNGYDPNNGYTATLTADAVTDLCNMHTDCEKAVNKYLDSASTVGSKSPQARDLRKFWCTTAKSGDLSCPDGFFATSIKAAFACGKCDKTCATCSSGDSCDSCMPGLIQSTNQKLCHCPDGYYGPPECAGRCSSHCAVCSSPKGSDCSKCMPGSRKKLRRTYFTKFSRRNLYQQIFPQPIPTDFSIFHFNLIFPKIRFHFSIRCLHCTFVF